MKLTFADKIKKLTRLTNDQKQLSFFGGWAIYTLALWLSNIGFRTLDGSLKINVRTLELFLFSLPFIALCLWTVYFAFINFFQESFKQRLWLYLLPLLIFEILLNLGLYLFISSNFFYSYFVDIHTNLAMMIFIYIPAIIIIIAALAIENHAKKALPPSSGLLDD